MAIIYHIFYAIVLLPLSILPHRLRYAVSDFLYLVLYKVLKYRRQVVETNIQHAFPNKSDGERDAIVKKFYRHLADLIMETIAMFSVTRAATFRAIEYEENEDLKNHFKENRSVIICSAHFNNYEYVALAADIYFPHKSVGIYLPLKNKFFDKKMKEARGKYGLTLIPTHAISRYMTKNEEEVSVTLFGFDQSPGDPKKSYWLNFLNQETAMIYGPEKIATHFNYPVYYGHLDKVSRGKYLLHLQLITDQPKEMRYGFITESLAQILEKNIMQHPEYWLWSHRRWKHKRPEQSTLHVMTPPL